MNTRLLLAAPIVGGLIALGGVKVSSVPPCTTPSRTPLEAVPYHFEVDEIALRSRGRLLMRDGFDRAGRLGPAEVAGRSVLDYPYFQNMGLLDGSGVRGGRLHIDESCSVNPFENFACDFSVPVDDRGTYSFVGADYFGDLDLDAKLMRPRIIGPEKFKIGLVDDQVFFGAATVSFEKNRVSLERQGGEPRTVTPFSETTFDEADLSRFGDLDELDLRLSVDASGRPSAIVKVRAGGTREVLRLTASAPWARLNGRARYSAHVFTEDLAKPRIFSVYPQTVSVEQLRASSGLLEMKIFGIGFGKDASLELTPDHGGDSSWARAADILAFNMGLKTKITLPRLTAGAYAVRVHTSNMTAAREKGLRVLE